MENAVSLKLPPFWAENPAIWFIQAETQFVLRNITVDETKYYHIVSALDHATARRLLDLLQNPPAVDKYATLKARLVSTFSLTRQQRAAALFDMPVASDRKPSEILDHMLELLGGHTPCLLFEHLFRSQLPADISMHITDAHFSNPCTLGQYADSLWQNRQRTPISNVEHGAIRSAVVSEMTIPSQGGTAPVVQSHATSVVARSGTFSKKKRTLCFFHSKFGVRATKCHQPCDWTENSPAARQ